MVAYSPKAACAILESYGYTLPEIEAYLIDLTKRGKVESSGYILGKYLTAKTS